MPLHSLVPTSDITALVSDVLSEPILMTSETNVHFKTNSCLERQDDGHHYTVHMVPPSFANTIIVFDRTG